MNVVGRVGNLISQGVYSVATPFHPFGGAVDIIAVEQEDGTYRSTPWYVRFGKFQGVIKGTEKIVTITVNGVEANFHMYLDHSGQAYFLREVESGGNNEETGDHGSKESNPFQLDQNGTDSNKDEFDESEHKGEVEKDEHSSGFRQDPSSPDKASMSPGFNAYSYGNLVEVDDLVKSSNDLNSEMVLVSVDGHVLMAPISSSEGETDDVQSSNPQFHLGPGGRTSDDFDGLFVDLDASTFRDEDNSGQHQEGLSKDGKEEEAQETSRGDFGSSSEDIHVHTSRDDLFKSCLDLTSHVQDADSPDRKSSSVELNPDNLKRSRDFSSFPEMIVEERAVTDVLNSRSGELQLPQTLTKDSESSVCDDINEEHSQVESDKVLCNSDLRDSERSPPMDGVIDSPKEVLVTENPVVVDSVDEVSSDMEQMGGVSGRSAVEEECCQKTDDPGSQKRTPGLGFEISLCGNLLRLGMGLNAAEEAFEAHRISEEEFKASGSSIIKNGNLIVRYGEKYFPWDKAACLVLGKAAFGSDFSWESKGSIPVNHVETSKIREDAHVVSPSSSRRWRLWPIPFRRAASLQHSNSNSSSEELFVDSESAWSPNAEQIPSANCNQSPRKQLMRTYIPTTEQIASLNLKDGQNIIAFSFSTRVLGKQEVDAHIYLWKWNARIVISDVDGTITRSDVLGQVMPLVGRDWTQSGVAGLFSAIKENGYQLLFLSARAIVQAYLTRSFLLNLKQDGKALPSGPVVISPDGLFPSLYREVIRRAPHEFKIACLEDIRALFPSDYNPFYAGFGNRDTDELSYRKIGIPKGKIFIINPKGEVAINHCIDVKSYTSLHTLVNDMFPPTSLVEQEDFNSWNYWRTPLPSID